MNGIIVSERFDKSLHDIEDRIKNEWTPRLAKKHVEILDTAKDRLMLHILSAITTKEITKWIERPPASPSEQRQLALLVAQSKRLRMIGNVLVAMRAELGAHEWKSARKMYALCAQSIIAAYNKETPDAVTFRYLPDAKTAENIRAIRVDGMTYADVLREITRQTAQSIRARVIDSVSSITGHGDVSTAIKSHIDRIFRNVESSSLLAFQQYMLASYKLAEQSLSVIKAEVI